MCFITQTSSPCDHPECKLLQQLITQQLQPQSQLYSFQQQASKDNVLQQLLNPSNQQQSQYYQLLLQQQLIGQQVPAQLLNQLLGQQGGAAVTLPASDNLSQLLEKRKYDQNQDILNQILMQQQQTQKKVKVDPLQQLLLQANRSQSQQPSVNLGIQQQLQSQQNLQNLINSIMPKNPTTSQNQLLELAQLFQGQNIALPTQQISQKSQQQIQQNLLLSNIQRQLNSGNSQMSALENIQSPLENNNSAMIAELGQIKKSSFDSQISQEETQDSVNSAYQCKSPEILLKQHQLQKQSQQQIKSSGSEGQQQPICAKKREEVEDQSKGQQYIKYEEISQNIRECLEEKKQFQYELVLKEDFPKILQRNKNFSITCELHNNQGKKIFNTNKIVLSICVLTYDIPQRLINLSKNWKKMVLGKTTTNLYQGQAYFDQVQLNAVTTYYKNSCIQLIIFPQQQLLEISEQSSNQFHVDFLEIKPIIIDNIVVKTRINDYMNAPATDSFQFQKQQQQQQQQQMFFSNTQTQPFSPTKDNSPFKQVSQSFQSNKGSIDMTTDNNINLNADTTNQITNSNNNSINNNINNNNINEEQSIPFDNNQQALLNQLKILTENSQIASQFSGVPEHIIQQLNQTFSNQSNSSLLNEELHKKPIQRQNIILKQIPTNELLNQSVN